MTGQELSFHRKRIALVAHDNRKRDLIEWVQWNYRSLTDHRLVCTGTTGKLVDSALRAKVAEEGRHDWIPDLTLLKSGPLGGDQQLGALVSQGEIDLIIFLWDPLEPHPHDVDVKALLRIAVVYNVPIACNRGTADFLITSHLLGQDYRPAVPEFGDYVHRDLPGASNPAPQDNGGASSRADVVTGSDGAAGHRDRLVRTEIG